MDRYIVAIIVVSFLIGCIHFLENLLYQNTEGLQKFTLFNKMVFFFLALVKIVIALKVSTLFIPASVLEEMEIDFMDNSLMNTMAGEVAEYEKYLVASIASAIAGCFVAIFRLKE